MTEGILHFDQEKKKIEGKTKKRMTINQKARLKNNKTTRKEIKNKEVLLGQPQIKGLTLKVYTMTPKKPNSALRKVAKVKLTLPRLTGRGVPLGTNKGIGPKKQTIITAYIPGEKHSLSIHNLVLVHPGKTQDLPGLKYKIIRGVLDCK